MKYFCFDPALPLQYHYAGKFKAPNAEWMHLTRQLMDFELVVVTQGTLYIGADQAKYTVAPGEYLLMAPVCHQYGTRAGDCSFYWLHFDSAQAMRAGTEGMEKSSISLPETSPDAAALNGSRETPGQTGSTTLFFPEQGPLPAVERIIILMKQLQDSDRRYGFSALNNLLAGAILSELALQSENRGKYAHQKETQLFSDIRDYIRLHVSEQLRVGAIADYFGYNEKYLSTIFRQWAGVPLKQYILQVKMDQAKAELSDTNRPISQIGYSLGYGDPHNFTNAFRKFTGLTPGAYREGYSKRRLNES